MKKIIVAIFIILSVCNSFTIRAQKSDTLKTIKEQIRDFDETGSYWIVTEERDPLTDKLKLLIMLPSNNDLENPNEFRIKGLSIMFIDDKPNLALTWDEYLGTNVGVAYRFDGGELESMNWSRTENGRSLLFAGVIIGRRAKLEGFIKRIIQSNELVVGVEPYRKRQQTAVFTTTGLGNVLLPYLHILGWEGLEATIRSQQVEENIKE